MKLDATLETRQKKDGNGTYKVVVLKLSDRSEKLIFLDPAELELLELHYISSRDNSSFPPLDLED